MRFQVPLDVGGEVRNLIFNGVVLDDVDITIPVLRSHDEWSRFKAHIPPDQRTRHLDNYSRTPSALVQKFVVCIGMSLRILGDSFWVGEPESINRLIFIAYYRDGSVARQCIN